MLHCPLTATSYFFVCVSLFIMMYLHINVVFGVQQGCYLALLDIFLLCNWMLKEHENLCLSLSS